MIYKESETESLDKPSLRTLVTASISQDGLDQLQNLTRDAILSRFEELHDMKSIQGLESLLSGE